VAAEKILTRRAFGRAVISISALGAVGLAGCDTPPPRPRTPELTYAHLGRFRLDVARIDVVSTFKPPFTAPNVEHLMPVSPEQVMRRWAADRLVATGTPGRTAQFVIEDAKVTDTKLPATPGLRGTFTTDQSDRYDASFAARLRIRAERGDLREGEASAWATRSRTVPENITVNGREQVWFELVEATMNDLNAELDRQIRANLSQFLR